MAKLQVLSIEGKKIKEISSPIFDGVIRKDLVQKISEVEKLNERLEHLYAPFYLSGMQTSASGNVKHNRHVWKSDRGKGLSRYPKKRMSDKGERFVWAAAAIPGVRGGRRAHPPKLLKRELKINKKEKILGMLSSLAMIASIDELKERYFTLKDAKINIKLPIVVEAKLLDLKSKEFFAYLKTILGEQFYKIAIQKKFVRAGKGKMRDRKYKKSTGLLIVIANSQNKKLNGVDVKKVNELKIKDLVSNGARLVMFTEEAIKDLEKNLGFGGK